MGMYEDLLNNLTNSSYPLQDIFLKLKILAKRLNNVKLGNFVEAELNGYNNENELPSYRKFDGILTGVVENAVARRTNVNLPTIHLKDEGLENIQTCYFINKLSEIESYTENENLTKPIPPEFYDILSKPLGNGYTVTAAYIPISKAKIKGILTGIRSALLDLMLSIEDQFTKTEIDTLFQNPTKEQLDKANVVINQFFISSFDSSTQNTKIELENDK